MINIEEEIRKIKERLSKLEQRVENLERLGKKKRIGRKHYKGATGGIRFLLDKGFFDKWRSLKEIYEELEREGYHYPASTISARLLEFVRDYKILVRKREKKMWKYAKRK